MTLLAALGILPDVCPPPPPRPESVSADFIGLGIPSATTSHAATHRVTETMRATDTDIISGLIRVAQFFFFFFSPLRVGGHTVSLRLCVEVGCILKSEKQVLSFYFIIIMNIILGRRIKEIFF